MAFEVYEYEGYRFEWWPVSGPWKLTRDGELAEQQGRAFEEAVARWRALSQAERDACRVE